MPPQASCNAGHLQEFRCIKGEDESTEGLSDDDKDAVDLTKLLSALQTGAVSACTLLDCFAPASCAIRHNSNKFAQTQKRISSPLAQNAAFYFLGVLVTTNTQWQ